MPGRPALSIANGAGASMRNAPTQSPGRHGPGFVGLGSPVERGSGPAGGGFPVHRRARGLAVRRGRAGKARAPDRSRRRFRRLRAPLCQRHDRARPVRPARRTGRAVVPAWARLRRCFSRSRRDLFITRPRLAELLAGAISALIGVGQGVGESVEASRASFWWPSTSFGRGSRKSSRACAVFSSHLVLWSFCSAGAVIAAARRAMAS